MSWYDPFNMLGAVGGAANDITSSMFPNPAQGSMEYLEQIPGIYQHYGNPYIEYGNRAMPTLEQQYSMLLNNPGALYSNLGQGFQTSPGYQFGVDQALMGSNAAMASAGMLGTPAHQQQNMNYANQLANQEYNNYMKNVMGLYGQGLSGTQGQFNTGYGASQNLANNIGNAYGSMANLQYAGQANQNQSTSGLLGGLAGMFGGFF